MKTAVIGTGNMGTALARLLADNGHSVVCWDHMPEVVDDIRKNHLNTRYLPGVVLPTGVTADLLLHHVVREAPMIFVAVPSLFFRQVVKEFSPFAMPHALVIGATKGLEMNTGKRMSEVYAETAVHPADHYVAMSGPSIANEFAHQKTTAVVLASPNRPSLQKAAETLSNPYFRVEVSDDQLGVELGGVLKNIYTLGFGFLTGLDRGSPTLRSAYVTIALREMKMVAERMGAQERTMDGFAGLGDLVTSCFSEHSHNRRLGELLAQGLEYDKAIEKLGGVVPEGVRTLPLVMEKVGRLIETPLARLIQTCVNQPALRSTFAEGMWQIVP